jgi:hypothetical protein
MTRRRREERETCVHCGGEAIAIRATGTVPLTKEQREEIEGRARGAMAQSGKCVVVPILDGRVVKGLIGVCVLSAGANEGGEGGGAKPCA